MIPIFTLLFIHFALFEFKTQAGVFEYQIEKLNKYQESQYDGCKGTQFSTSCSPFLIKLIEDDYENGFFNTLPSRAPICLKQLESSQSQKLWADQSQNLLSNLTPQFNTCVKNTSSHKIELVAKNYYYTSRLNEGLKNLLSNEQMLNSLLKNESTSCEELKSNKNSFGYSFDYCQKLKACPNNTNIETLSSDFKVAQTMTFSIKEKLSSLPTDCSDTSCTEFKELASAQLLNIKNQFPWIDESEFQDPKLTNDDIKKKLQVYFHEILKKGQNLKKKITQTLNCIEGPTESSDCSISDARNLVDQMPQTSESSNKVETKQNGTHLDDNKMPMLTNILAKHLSDMESCIEGGAIDRENTATILKDSAIDTALLFGSGGWWAIPRLAKYGIRAKHLTLAKVGVEGSVLLGSAIQSTTAWSKTIKVCGADEKPRDLVCLAKSHYLSPEHIDLYKCRMSVLFSMLATLPIGSQYARWAEELKTIDPRLMSRIAQEKNPIRRYLRTKKAVINEMPISSKLKTMNDTSQSIKKVEKVEESELKDLTKLSDGFGYGYREIYTAKLNGQKVFIKESSIKVGAENEINDSTRTFQSFNNEIAWAKRLSDLNVGPKFKGVVKTKDGFWGSITEFFPGVHMQGDLKLPISFKPKKELIDSLKKIKKVIAREGIEASDFQIRISETEAKVIDPEFYRSASKIGEVDYHLGDIDELIEFLETNLNP